MNTTTGSFPHPALPVRRYVWRLRAEDSLRLPDYAGSMLRGAFGHALRQIACVTRQKVCTDCPLQSACSYSYLFETPVPASMAVLRRYPSAPHPIVIEAPLGPRDLAAGESFGFSMVLIGRALFSVPMVVLAWQRACASGIGSRRISTVLEAYREEGERDWRAPEDPAPWKNDTFVIPPMPEGELILRFLTPYRGKQEGRLTSAAQLRFRDFFSHLQRRVGLLCAFHGTESEWRWDYVAALEIAERVCWEPLDAHWMDWIRYSSRQAQEMHMGGVLGSYRISNADLKPLWPLLYLGQWTHAGKNTSFGLGQYVIIPAAQAH